MCPIQTELVIYIMMWCHVQNGERDDNETIVHVSLWSLCAKFTIATT